MNILHICGRLSSGGIKIFVESLIDLNENNHSVHDLLLIFRDDRVEVQNKCKVHYLDYFETSFLSCFKKVAQTSSKYDAFMIHSAHPVVIFPLLFSRKPCFIFQHGMSVSSGPVSKRAIKKLWYSFVPVLLNAKVICSTEFAVKKTRKLGIFLQRKRCVVIPFGISLKKESGKVRNLNGNGALKIGMAGRLVAQKRNDIVLKSLLSYKGKTKLHFQIAGEGSEFSNLRELAQRINHRNVMIDLLGNVTDMDSFYDDIDFFLFPSQDESFGLVLLEALTRFIPVAVFSDVGGCLNLVQNGRNGFILRNGIRALEELWQKFDEDASLVRRQSGYLAHTDFGRLDISNTRLELEELVKINS